MQILDLSHLGSDQILEADLIVVGGGPAGLTVAREFFGRPTRVIVVESGNLEEDGPIAALNTVESVGEPSTAEQMEQRSERHGALAQHWSQAAQPFGVRCRVLGGSSHAWAGKSAAFAAEDFAVRPWIANSGWPIGPAELQPYLDRAAEHLNLGPNVYDGGLWELIGREPAEPRLDPLQLKSCFWQFARSRLDAMDSMRFGPEFAQAAAPNVRVILNATATRILTNGTATCVEGVEIACLQGMRATVRGPAIVLAASAIENPRLLLASRDVVATGLGNEHDVVGRYLMDHQSARIGRFEAASAAVINRRFGFQGVRSGGRTHLYMHGLCLPPSIQEHEGLLNCALYMMEQRAPDDPLDALKRLLRGKSATPMADLLAIARGPGIIAKGAAIKAFQSSALPGWLKRAAVDSMLRVSPGHAVREHLDRGLPHKLLGLVVEGISEQRPDPESRITLSTATDPLGVPRARIDWRMDRLAVESMGRLGRLMALEFPRAGLPAPQLEDWIDGRAGSEPAGIDMAHTMGTTRMSENPRQGVVDATCRVHGVAGLFVAGGSVFPTGGHANPTLMIVALAVRLADHLKEVARKAPPRLLEEAH